MNPQVEISRDGSVLKIKILHNRIDGDNHIIHALEKGNFIQDDVAKLEFDFEKVEYLNSLGITEFININRKFPSGSKKKKSKFVFLNVSAHIYGILELVEMHKMAEIHLKNSAG